MDMTQLNGHEASVLAFIARFPKSKDATRLAKTLDGAAKEIAEALLKGRSAATDVSSSAAARAMRNWAAAS